MEDFEYSGSTRQGCQGNTASAGALSASPEELLSSADIQDSSVQSTMEVETITPATPECGASGNNEGVGPVVLLEAEPPTEDSSCQVITSFSQLDGHVTTEGSQGTEPPLHDSAELQLEAEGASLPLGQCDMEESLDSTGVFDQAPGTFDCKLVDTSLQEEYECPICNMIARKPAKVSCCGQIFCDACITTQTKCPICRDAFEHCMVDKLLERKIRHLEVHCVNQEEGCGWTGELRDVAQHLQDPTIYQQQSGTDRCQYQLTTCKRCDQELLYIDVSHHTDSVCEHRVVSCEYEFAGCHFKCPEMNMPQHRQESTSMHLALVSKLVKEEKAVSSKLRWCYCFTLVALLVCFFILFSCQEARINALEEASLRLLHLMEEVNAKQIGIDMVGVKSGMMTYINDTLKYFSDFLPYTLNSR